MIARAAVKRNAVQRNAATLRAAHQAKLEQSNDDYYYYFEDRAKEDEFEKEPPKHEQAFFKPPDYFEQYIYGLIDGLAADFDETCAMSMYGVVDGGFRAKEYWNIVIPTNTMKFQMAIDQLVDSTNSVYAFCDFSLFYSQLSTLTNFGEWQNYITLASRVMGSYMSAVGDYNHCIQQGKMGGNGYDVGICTGGKISMWMDVSL